MSSGAMGEPVCAWAVLGAWRGSKLLFAQVIDQVGAAVEASAVDVVIHGTAYAETFVSSADFRERASPEGLARLESVDISAGDPSRIHVSLHLQKDQLPRSRWAGVPYPRSGALLTVVGAEQNAVVAARDALVGVLRQGNLWRVPRPSRGEGDCAEAPRRALLSRGKWSDVGDIAGTLVFVPSLALLVASLHAHKGPCKSDAKKTCTDVGLDMPSGSDLLAPLLIGIALAVALAYLRYRRPSVNPALWVLAPVEIADRSTARKALALGVRVFLGLIPLATILGWVAVALFG